MLWVEWLQGFPEIELDSFSDYFRDDIHIEDAHRMLRSSSHIRRSDMRNNNLWTQYCVNGTLVIYLYILLKKALHHLDIQNLNTSINFLGLFWHRLGYFVWKRHIHSVWLLHWVWNSGKLTEFSRQFRIEYHAVVIWYILCFSVDTYCCGNYCIHGSQEEKPNCNRKGRKKTKKDGK